MDRRNAKVPRAPPLTWEHNQCYFTYYPALLLPCLIEWCAAQTPTDGVRGQLENRANSMPHLHPTRRLNAAMGLPRKPCRRTVTQCNQVIMILKQFSEHFCNEESRFNLILQPDRMMTEEITNKPGPETNSWFQKCIAPVLHHYDTWHGNSPLFSRCPGVEKSG